MLTLTGWQRERERESNLMDWCSVSLTASVIPLVFTHSIFTNRESLIKNNYHKYFISFVIFRKSKKKKKTKKTAIISERKGEWGREKEKERIKNLVFFFSFFFHLFDLWTCNVRSVLVEMIQSETRKIWMSTYTKIDKVKKGEGRKKK